MSKIILITFWIVVMCFVTVLTADSFKHPGVLVSHSQLDYVKTKLTHDPWMAAYKKMIASNYASMTFNLNPRKVVECGSHSHPNNGCSEERESAIAAYTHALMWYYTDNKTHADEAIKIMDAWSAEITSHNNSNAPLQTGWAGAVWPRAAEIIKHTKASWAEDKVKRFEDMLRHVYLPELENSDVADMNGNWELIMIEAIGNIAVFLDDHATFEKAVSRWRKRVPAYIYLKSDGANPVPPPNGNRNTTEELIRYWAHQHTFVDGIAQETCRDFKHTTYGIGAAINFAETAWHQGLDLYKEGHDRFVHALEFHADYILGTPAPQWLCNGKISIGHSPIWEIGYNHYHNRMKVNMPKTETLITKHLRPTGTEGHFIAWETLTHAENMNN